MPESSPQESPVYTVIVSEKGGSERREVFRTGEVTVGRVHGNDIVLPRGNVSKRHARVLYREGRFIVTDLNSTNGTYVNRKRIAQATIVREEDKIYVGDFVLRVEPGEASPEPPSTRDSQPDRELAPEGRVSSIDWDRPSSFDEQRVSSGPPGVLRAGVSEAPPRAERSGSSHGVDELASAHLKVVAGVVGVAWRAFGEISLEFPPEHLGRLDSIVNEAADDLMLRGAVPTGTSLEAIVLQARSELVDLGPLGELLADASVTTISISRYDDIVVRRDDRLVRIAPGFSSPESLKLAIRRLCARSGEPVARGEDVVERRLGEHGRLSALLGPTATSGPLVVLRKPKRTTTSLDGLVRRGAISRAMATFLNVSVASRLNVLVVGSEEDGAAMVMSALCGVAARDRLVTLSEELDFAPEGAARLQLEPAKGTTDPRQVLEFAAQVPDVRLAVHLTTPTMALATLEALGKGTSGVIALLPSSDLRRALLRLSADLCVARPGLSLPVASAWLEGSFDLLVEVVRLRDGRVRTLRVSELDRGDQGALVLNDIFRFHVQRVAVGGSVEGSFGPTGYVPRVAAQLQALGANVENSMFSRPPSR